MLRFVNLVCVLCIVLTAQFSAAQELKWKFQKGDKFRVKFDQLSNSNTDVLDRKVVIKNFVEMEVLWQVAEVDSKGTATMVQVINWARMEMTSTDPDGGTKSIKVDTREEPEGKVATQMLKDIAPVVGMDKTIKFKMSAAGEISDFEIPKSTMESIRKAPSSMSIRKIFSADGMKSVFGPASIKLPDGKLEAGKTWDSDRELTSDMGKFKQKFVYKLSDSSNANTAMIDINCETKRIGENKSKIEIKSQSGTGTIKFDVANGYLSDSKFKTEVETETPYRDFKIQIKTRDEATVEIRKVGS